MTTKRNGAGRPPKLTPAEREKTDARFELMKAVIAAFPALRTTTLCRQAELPTETLRNYLSKHRQPMPEQLDKLERVMSDYYALYLQKLSADKQGYSS